VAQAQWEVTWTYHSSSLSTHLGFERKRQSVEPVGAWCIWEQATYDDRLSSFSKALLLKYKTCADRLSGHRLLDMTNTKHDMKADGNTLQNPADVSPCPHLLPVRTYSKNSEICFRRFTLSATTSGETCSTALHNDWTANSRDVIFGRTLWQL